jgi:septal ring factor EnvC (AmiA/AmiB activator)
LSLRAALLSLALLAAVSPSRAASSAEAIAAAESDLEGALAALESAESAQVPELAAAVAAYEDALGAVRSAIASASSDERAEILGLLARREEVSRFLGALQRMDPDPPPARSMHPLGPLAAARVAGMAERIVPGMAEAASGLEETLREIAAARALQARGVALVTARIGDLAAGQTSLAEAMAAEMATAAAPATDPEMAGLVRGSETLTEFARALAGDPAGEVAPPALARPVEGFVRHGFRMPDASGARRPGLVIEAAPRAQVRAPAAGIVRYAGPFLDFGQVVVLEPAPGVTVVLAGLERVRVSRGSRVAGGELLGLLGGAPLGADDYLMMTGGGTGAGARETLYVEIAERGAPVDPEPLFEGDNG